MKTILLVFFISAFGLWAQTSDDADAAAREAAERAALRAAIAGTNIPAPVTNIATTPATNIASTPAAPSAPGIRFTPTPTNTAAHTNFAQQTVTPSTAATVSTNPPVTVPAFPAFPAFPTPPAGRGNGRNAAGNRTPNFALPGAPRPTNAPPAGVPAVVPAPVMAQAAPAEPPPKMIEAGEIDFQGAPLEQVLQVYSDLVGRTVLHAQLPATQITIKTETPLTRKEAVQAIDTVLAMNGFTMINQGEKFVKAVPVNLAYQQGTPFTTTDESQLPEADQYITHIVQLRYSKPSELLPVLQPLGQIPNSIFPIDSSQILIIRDYAANVKRMLELIKQIDVTVPLEYDSEVIPIKYAQASDIASALSSLGGGSGTTIGKAAGGGGTGAGTRTGTGLNGGGAGGYPGSTGAFGGQAGTTGGAFGGAGGASGSRTSSFGDRLNAIVKKAASQGDFDVLGQTKIIADQRTNSLLVFASKADMAMIKKIVAQLDIVLAQVLIEAIIMEVSLDRGNTFAASYAQNNPSAPGNYFSGLGGINNGTFLNPGNFQNIGTNLAGSIPSGLSYFANFGGDFNATLTAIANDSRITVLSRPRIQTSHGVKASLQVGDTVPEVTGTYFGGLTGGTASSQYQQTFVGIDLEVTPLINPDGLVVMDISQDVEQLGTPTTIDGNPVPTTSKRTAEATVSVRDRDTIILGGMISTSKSTTRAGVPFLKDIPGLGYLFRSTSDDNTRKELIVLIRPTVLPTPEAAALTATHEIDKMPAVKQAEYENKMDEIKRQKAAAKIKVPDDN